MFAGPGRYKDGAASTPLRILQKAISSDDHRMRLKTIFNDLNPDNAKNLKAECEALDGYSTLAHPPVFWNIEIGKDITESLESQSTIPILAFIDPWGYKGLSTRLVSAFLKNWGCDCIFFFNYSRINAGISNPLVKQHMEALFGEQRLAELAPRLEGMLPTVREAVVVEELAQELKSHGHPYVLPFTFKKGKRTTHHLFLVSKSFKAYEVMKDIMAKASSVEEQGVPSFTYLPAADRAQTLLFDLNRPLDDLRGLLLSDLAGRTMTTREIYEYHSVDRPYLARNYKAVLTQLEREGVVRVAGRKPKKAGGFVMQGFPDHLVVTFPVVR